MRRWTPMLSFLAVLVIGSVAMACPMCKDSIANNDAAQGAGLPSGFNTSVYVLLTGFLATLSLVIGVIVKGIRG